MSGQLNSRSSAGRDAHADRRSNTGSIDGGDVHHGDRVGKSDDPQHGATDSADIRDRRSWAGAEAGCARGADAGRRDEWRGARRRTAVRCGLHRLWHSLPARRQRRSRAGVGVLRGPPWTGAVADCPDRHQRIPVPVTVPPGQIPRAMQAVQHATQLHIKSTPCPRHDAKPMNGG